jgi:hypothetical protein
VFLDSSIKIEKIENNRPVVISTVKCCCYFTSEAGTTVDGKAVRFPQVTLFPPELWRVEPLPPTHNIESN